MKNPNKFFLVLLTVLFTSGVIFAQNAQKCKGVAKDVQYQTITKASDLAQSPMATSTEIDFEDEVEFTFDFDPWTTNDIDGLATYGFPGIDFPNQYAEMAYIVFDPTNTIPPMTDDPEIQPHSGEKFGACMASVPTGGDGNDDWFISPQLTLEDGASFTFWAKSYTDQYGLEKFNVAVSTGSNNPDDFTVISGGSPVQVPVAWTEYTYDLSSYAGEDVYIAIQCVSYDAFVFMIDDLVVTGAAGPQTVLYEDDFESYTTFGYIAEQNPDWWDTWSGNVGGAEDGMIFEDVAMSGSKSVLVNGLGGATNLLMLLGDKVSGAFDVNFYMYIPEGYCGYYNFQHMEAPGIEWAFEMYFHTDETCKFLIAGETLEDYTYSHDTWIYLEHKIDLDNDHAELYIDGVFYKDWQWSLQAQGAQGANQLGGINFFAGFEGFDLPKYYFDDVEYLQTAFQTDPIITLDPIMFEQTLEQGETATQTLTVGNIGATDLDYEIAVIYDLNSDRTPITPNVTPTNNHILGLSPSATPTGNSQSPAATDDEVTLNYDGDNSSAIGWASAPVDAEVAAMFPTSMTGPHTGMELTSVFVYINDLGENFKLKIYGMGTAISPGSLLVEQEFSPAASSWDYIELDEPLTITGEDFWVGYSYTQQTTDIFIPGCDAGPNNPNGDWLKIGDSWEHLSSNPDLPFNWNIRANLTGEPITQWLSVNPTTGIVAPTETQDVNVNFDATGVEAGTHGADIVVFSNDPENSIANIPVTLTVESSGSHWNVSGDPTGSIWAIYIGGATIDGQNMVPGDEIAIFDGDLIVGVITLTQICTPDNQFDNVLNAYSLLFGEPGYTVGNTFTMKAWDQSENMEFGEFNCTFYDPYGDAYVGDVFPDGEPYSIVSSDFSFNEPAPILTSATPGYKEVSLEWEAIPDKNKTNHFDFVGGDPGHALWSIYISSATFNGSDMEPGDEIGIFDGDLLVGIFNLDQVCTPENQFDNDLIAFNVLFSGNGYQPGNPFTIVAWDESEQKESISFDYIFSNPYGDAWTGDTFPEGDFPYSMLDFIFYGYVPSFIIYYEDGTLVAADVEGNTFTDTELIAGVEYCYYITQILENGMESLPSNILCAIPYSIGNISGVVCDIDNNPIEGASVIIEETAEEVITNEMGEYFFEDVSTGTYSLTASHFSHYTATIYSVEVFENETTIVDFFLEPKAPTLISLTPGIEEMTLEWEAIPDKNKTGHFDFGNGGDPTGSIWAIYIGSATFNGADMEAGDEIAIFDGDLMVGVFTLSQICTPVNQFENPLNAFALLFDGPGYTAGNSFTLKAWDQSEGIESTSFEYVFNNQYPYGNAYVGDVFPNGEPYSIAEFTFTAGYLPAFNIYYEDGTLVASEVEGNTFTDTDLIGGEEYCYYVTQIFENGSESVGSNILCDVTLAVGNIEGIVYDVNSNPLEGVSVKIEETGDMVSTNEFGEYLFENITPDTYSLTASLFLYYSSTINNIEVIGNETTIVDFFLEPKAPNLISVTPGIEENTLEWESIVDDNETGHFDFGNGGDPSGDIWTIYIGGATFDGSDMEAGDEIAIFDGELMVGVFTLSQICTPDNQLENAFLAFNSLFIGQGYSPGNSFTFIAWDESEGIESGVFNYTFSDPYGSAYTGDVFPEGNAPYSMAEITFLGYQPVFNIYYEDGSLVAGEVEGNTYTDTDLIGGQEYCYYITQIFTGGQESAISNVLCATPTGNTGIQNYDLQFGFQFISSRLISEDPDMLVVIEEILNDNLDFVRNSLGQSLRKIGPIWVNGIGDWIVDEGYLVKMFAADSFTIEGDIVDPATPIPVETGFQFISYFPENPMDALIAFETIIGDDLDFIRNSQGQTLRKIGPIWVNGIGDCQPGQGYLVKMYADDILIYPGSSSFTCGDPFTDPRDEQTYETVQIGDQCWMAENLNIGEMINGTVEMTNNGVIEKYCYDNDPANCEIYGGLFQWDEMMEYVTDTAVQGICPIGWHLPTNHEWKILEGTVDSQYPVGDPIWNNSGWRGYDAGLNLKSVSGWHLGGNGSGLYNYEALPGGFRHDNGNFHDLTINAIFWSSSVFNSSDAWYGILYYDYDEIYRSDNSKLLGFSVRCLQDNSIFNNLSILENGRPNELLGQEVKNLVAANLIFEGGNPADPVYSIYVQGLEVGDEVAAYDGDILVGAMKINSTEDFENELPVFSTLTNGQGYEEGKPISFKVWSENKLVSTGFTMEAIYDAYVSDVYPEGDGKYSIVNITKERIEKVEESISIFPNPSEGIFNISIEGVSGKVQIKVFDVHGNEYRFFEVEGTKNIITEKLDLNELAAGVYFISFSGKDFSQVKKIVIQ